MCAARLRTGLPRHAFPAELEKDKAQIVERLGVVGFPSQGLLELRLCVG